MLQRDISKKLDQIEDKENFQDWDKFVKKIKTIFNNKSKVSQDKLLTYLWYLNFEYTLRGLGVIQKFNNDDNDD